MALFCQRNNQVVTLLNVCNPYVRCLMASEGDIYDHVLLVFNLTVWNCTFDTGHFCQQNNQVVPLLNIYTLIQLIYY